MFDHVEVLLVLVLVLVLVYLTRGLRNEDQANC